MVTQISAGSAPATPETVAETDRITACIKAIADPELPALTIGDLGMVREVVLDGDGGVRVAISPTYSGCPANEFIMQTVRETVRQLGYEAVVKKALAPAWSSDWITEQGRQKLRAAGIAPPTDKRDSAWFAAAEIACVKCGDARTKRLAEFGATPCKALYQCQQCGEPFEYFKCL